LAVKGTSGISTKREGEISDDASQQENVAKKEPFEALSTQYILDVSVRKERGKIPPKRITSALGEGGESKRGTPPRN